MATKRKIRKSKEYLEKGAVDRIFSLVDADGLIKKDGIYLANDVPIALRKGNKYFDASGHPTTKTAIKKFAKRITELRDFDFWPMPVKISKF